VKTKAVVGKQHQEGLPVAAECKRLEEASRGQGYLEVNCLKRTEPDMVCCTIEKERGGGDYYYYYYYYYIYHFYV
jgi:hypothetical protein